MLVTEEDKREVDLRYFDSFTVRFHKEIAL